MIALLPESRESLTFAALWTCRLVLFAVIVARAVKD